MNNVFRQIAELMTAQNAKQVARIMEKLAEEINPQPPAVDRVTIHDLRISFLKLPYDNLPQKKRIRKLLKELEEVIGNGNVD